MPANGRNYGDVRRKAVSAMPDWTMDGEVEPPDCLYDREQCCDPDCPVHGPRVLTLRDLAAMEVRYRDGMNEDDARLLFAAARAGLSGATTADTERLDFLEREGAIVTLIRCGVLEWQSKAPPASLREAIDNAKAQRSGSADTHLNKDTEK